jgi:creatinine amidohydrolase/Fe(II)-dependent formamide hydrolase-like protein
MARATAKAIALKLGNAIVMPTLAYSPNRASADLPGTIGLSNEVFGQMLTEISEQAIITGFKNVMIMGDHGGGQPAVFAEVAKKLDAKYAPQGKHVYFVDEVYKKAQDDFDDWLVAHGYPRSSHAGIPDTSTMLYLGAAKTGPPNRPTAEGDPVPAGSARPGPRRRRRSQRAAAQEQRHQRRRAPLVEGARQAGVRHQGELRGEADHRVPRESAQGHRAAVILQLQDCRK